MQEYDIAIIGGGFSGTLAAHHLVQWLKPGRSIVILDSAPNGGRGIAYSTTRLEHPLNVRTAQMGAFPDKPDDFYRWLESAAGGEACAARSYTYQAGPDGFAPRALYGDYLHAIHRNTEMLAKQKNIACKTLSAEVTDIAPLPGKKGFSVRLHTGETLDCAHALLACGNRFEAPPSSPHGRVTAAPWQFDYTTLVQQEDTKPVLIMGSGLTAVDTILSVLESGFKHDIAVVSRNGLFPAAHTRTPYPPQPLALPSGEIRLSQIMHCLRNAARKAAQENIPWQTVIDGLRPHTAPLWQTLPPGDQQRLVEHYFTLWNIHRHRMDHSIAEKLEAAQRHGRLHLFTGNIERTQETEKGVSVTFSPTAKGKRPPPPSMDASCLFRCVGPRYGVNASPLFQKLLASGLVQATANGYGLRTIKKDGHTVAASGSATLLALGPALFGERLETTAVPELRAQAQAAASIIAASL